jgi:hypothetical protein
MVFIEYLKQHGWLTAAAIVFDLLAIKFWYEYLAFGGVHDGKHGITFYGEYAYGHLAGVSIAVLILNYYLAKSLLKFYRSERK